jgi:EpsI family protein
MSSFVMRVYSKTGIELDQTAAAFSVYVGYYASQTRGRTIHSPKNCLPGSGWQALASESIPVETQLGQIRVNKYLLQRGEQKALVLYWYQGRGRIESNEYRVKWNLLMDSALKRRSDEALVRLVVPTRQNEAEAYRTATELARKLVPIVASALPQA